MSCTRVVAVFLSSILVVAAQGVLVTNQPGSVPPWQATIASAYQALARGDSEQGDKLMDQALRAALTGGPLSDGFVAGVQQAASYYRGAGLELKANAILKDAIDMASRDQAAEIRTQLEFSLANLYTSQGREMKGLALFRQIVARMEHEHGGEVAQMAGILEQAAWAAERVGNFDEAEKLVKQAIALRRSPAGSPGRPAFRVAVSGRFHAFTGNSPDQAEVSLAQLYERNRRFAEAEQTYATAIEKAGTATEAVYPLQMYAQFLRGRKRFQEAEAVQKRIIAIHEASTTDGGPAVHWDRQNLAHLYLESGNYESANKLIDEEVVRASRSPASTGEYFHALTMKADALIQQNNYAAAEAAAAEALNAAQDEQPYQKHWAYSKMAEIAEGSGDSKKAQQFRAQATAATASLNQQQGIDFTMQRFQEAQTTAQAGRVDEAVRLVDEALSSMTTSPNRMVACGALFSATGVAYALLNQHREAAADTVVRRMLAAAEQTCSNHPNNVARYDGVISYFVSRGLVDEAKRITDQWNEAIIVYQGADSPALESVIRKRTDIARAEQNHRQASALEEELLKLIEVNHGPDSQMAIQEKQTLAARRASRGDFSGAEELWVAALRGTERMWSGTGMHASLLSQISDFYLQIRRFDEARRYAKQAIEISAQSDDPSAPGEYFVERLKEIDRLQKQEEDTDQQPVGPAARPAVASPWFDSAHFQAAR